MPSGYLVSLGGNNALNSGDTISGATVTFTTQTSLGSGQWTWSGTYGGTAYTNELEPGQYFLATDGNVYFVPDYGPVATLTSSSVISSPTFAPTMGTSGGDTLVGGTGNDTIYGGSTTSQNGTGNDVISGGTGNDVIFAGDGNDTLQGGAGADTLYGGAGTDTVSYSGSGSAVNVNLSTNTATGGNATGDVLNSIEDVVGSNFNDTLTGSTGANYIDGGAGADTISAGDGNDTVLGGEGNDTINAGAGNDSVSGGMGNDSIFGGSGSDAIDGGGGADRIHGGDGADAILGGDGNDTIYGGAQTTTATQEHLSWIGQGAGGTNLASGFTQDTGGMHVTASFVNDGSNTAIQTSGSTQYVGGGEPFSTTSGLYLTGTGGPNVTTTLTFDAESGSGLTSSVSNVSFRINDIDMRGWQDIITVTAYDINGNPITVNITMTGNDSVSGNTITAAYSDDTASIANGSALISIPGPVHSIQISYSNGGTAGQALWITDVHYTTVPVTNAADTGDTIDGGTGSDLIYGQTDDDTINLTGTFGNDTIVGGETGETAGDLINSSTLTQDTTLTFSGNEAGTLTDGSSAAAFSEIERFQLGSGDDVINATATKSGVNVDGGAGNDTLIGGSGDDQLSGGAGADSVTGGAGDDTIDLGLNDSVADTVDLEDGSGSDVISNFVAPTDNGDGTYTGHDQFDVSDLTDAGGSPVNAWDVTVSDTNGDGTGDAILTFPNGESVTLVGVTPSQVDSAAKLNAMGIPCFTRGAMIATPRGEISVEDLQVGDTVWTRDSGAQTIRWIGSKRVAAIGPLAPVLIPEGTLGNSRDIKVSPQHRMLIGGWKAELYYGETEVLVAAKHLVDGSVIRFAPGGEVEYFHILFDRHEIVVADGAPSESFHPGDQGLSVLDEDARREVFMLFPELETKGPASYGPAARRSLKAHEAVLLRPGSTKTAPALNLRRA
ncbi:Hint domain-containing protein [Defluviimonas sp. WL0050]|uniref:Hint domain-containing protein n=1 Tax=Albidovulum litorale TaxID=2984134 RepID=A0ABT2ZRB5_9RHOB|nr:Hint domain-containing protein [Defluviimonas sp. WL0050]MCV2873558.1 Hint domain-containing protein [Defluviimonas sp. WL0050]